MIKRIKNKIQDIKTDYKINKKLKMMNDHKFKELDLYKNNPFTIVDASLIFDFNYTSYDFNSEDFELQHRTSLRFALGIVNTKLMFGTDVNEAAHFEGIKGSNNSSYKSGVIIYFRWKGPQESVRPTHKEEENKLFHVGVHDYSDIEENGRGYWESRIYPGTKSGLELIGLASDSNNKNLLLFDEPINISIIRKKEFDAQYCTPNFY
jgi:hypothetical protein